MKRMKHPLHGFHHALDGAEEARMRTHGWVDDAPEKVAVPEQVKTDTAPARRTRGPNKPKE
jgi:hypothetical protein